MLEPLPLLHYAVLFVCVCVCVYRLDFFTAGGTYYLNLGVGVCVTCTCATVDSGFEAMRC